MRIRFRNRFVVAACVVVVVAPFLALDATRIASADSTSLSPPTARATPAELGPIGHDGRWLTTGDGRVLMLNGVNFVDKSAITPAGHGFGADDAAWLAANGIDVVRLGFSPLAIMPKAGVLDTAYIDSFVRTVDLLEAHGLLVLIDLHQDGWGPAVDGNGFPAWMTLTHGATNTHTAFPLYYVTNPAIQAAFDSFWSNEKGPGGVSLQARTATMFGALAERLADNDAVLGYDLINEPWPGTDFGPCAAEGPGCPGQDAASLDPYYRRMTTAIRAKDQTHMIFGEPWVLFNFGLSPTNIELPGGDANSGMSFHMYTVDVAREKVVVDEAKAWSERTGGALLGSEFGASSDTAANDRQIKEFDNALIPWIFWSYDEQLVRNLKQPTAANVVDSTADAVVRPHPLAVAGTPTALDYEQPGRVLRFTWSTTGPDSRTYPAGTETTFQVVPRTYPKGYRVRIVGGSVTSAADAPSLTVVADEGSAKVTVVVYPADAREPELEPPADPAPSTPATASPSTAPAPAAVPPEAPAAEPIATTASFTG